jgi:hypothetical protein
MVENTMSPMKKKVDKQTRYNYSGTIETCFSSSRRSAKLKKCEKMPLKAFEKNDRRLTPCATADALKSKI